MSVRRVIHRSDPYAASRAADAAGRRAAKKDPEQTRYFAAREVLNRDGTFPFGEGFLYQKPAQTPATRRGLGVPGDLATFGHHGSKREQQDAFGAARFLAGKQSAAALVVADGVSASGPLAKRSSNRATRVFLERVQRELAGAPSAENLRHPFVEKAIEKAAFQANFEVVRQVLLDRKGDGRFDARDRAALERLSDIDLPTGPMTDTQMKRLAPKLDAVVRTLDEQGRSALTTFAAAVVVGDDLYAFSSGDAVVSLHRPSEPKGHRLLNLTHRDQEVVALYAKGGDTWKRHGEVYENVITDAFGDSARLTGTLRRYPNVLRPGDRVVVSSDGLGPRSDRGQGLDRKGMERVLDQNPEAGAAARALVRLQVKGLTPDEYQDNVGVAVLDVVAP